jgi:16S rRNA (uracil1498-N3)-methyltransferase
MPDRYFVESPISADRAALTGAEAHHLLHVMRAKIGTQVTLFDGSGWEFEAFVERTGRSEVELAIRDRQEIDREAPIAVSLGVALPKGERQKWLVEKVVELGIARLVPLETNRCVAQPGENAQDRLRRAVIEASKQCGRNRLMEIAPPVSWSVFIAEGRPADCRLVAHPANRPGAPSFRQFGAGLTTPMRSVSLAIGPEGGFTEEEVAEATARQWQIVDLGPRILRVETAAVALAARIIGCGWQQ